MSEAGEDLRPMGIGDILDTTFRLYRNHFATFVLIALVVYVPYAVVDVLLIASLVDEQPQPLPTAEVADGVALAGFLAMALLFVVVFPLCQGALVHKISAGYLGESIGAVEAYRRALPRLLRLIWANILAGVVIMVGFIFFIVPGIIFSLWLMLVTTVVMLEDGGAMDALKRSRELMRGNLGKGFLLLLVITLLSIGYTLVTELLAVPLAAVPLLDVFVVNLLAALILPITTAPIILLYYDLRIRKEAFDLERLAAAMPGQDLPLATPES